ncbi:nitrate reductase [Flexibacterium corallicola]|uniref:nitrate reductase n=1 Tax=Flexibacterium corallicola TaxID=3037259 RepID=UPI00286F7F88|nr:nitrate reductase [Pseudovibrio sp. M1P-2-3]
MSAGSCTETTRSTCPYCGVGCGVLVNKQQDGSVEVKGDPDHPANFGRLCSKGMALGETLDMEGRLLFPKVHGQRKSWDEALDLVANTFARTIAEHGPDSVAFYGSGQMLTEDYYVANKLMKGFMGTANIDSNSRLCMASSVAGHKIAFGSDTVPGTYEDLEQADLVVLVGSNAAWCHPVLFQRILAAKASRPSLKLVVIDPRQSASTQHADMHLQVRPDGDSALFAGLLDYLSKNNFLDQGYISAHTQDFGLALTAAKSWGAEAIEAVCGLETEELEGFYKLFARTEKVVTLYSQGVNQSSSGTAKVGAILNCHLATGRIGRVGMGPFSLTGQPNAMGGREVGALANMLAAHMSIEDESHRQTVSDFWETDRLAFETGLKAVEMFDAVASGEIKAIWIMATSPVDSMPNGDLVETALKNCEFVVTSDILGDTDTLRHAHVALPSLGWGEKSGTVTNSERRISRQRAFLSEPEEARADWWQLAQVGQRMGFEDAFSFDNPVQIFREHAALSGYQNNGERDFDISAYDDVSEGAYEALTPFQWPRTREPARNKERFFSDGGFFHKNGRARFVQIEPQTLGEATHNYAFTLNTGRIRDQWHTMTRTGKSARLSAHLGEPFAEIHPEDALALGIRHANLVEVSNGLGKILVRALITSRQSKGEVFVPMHWSDQFASNARVDRLVPPKTDGTSGQPAFKNVGVKLRPYVGALYGFVVSRKKPELIDLDYWVVSRCEGGWSAEFAHTHRPANITERLQDLFKDSAPNQSGARPELVSMVNDGSGLATHAGFQEETLLGAAFMADRPVGVSRGWARGLLGFRFHNSMSRHGVLAGLPSNGSVEPGALICSCMNVGVNQIALAIEQGASSLDQVAAATNAGTGCGSCRGDILRIIEDLQVVAAQ